MADDEKLFDRVLSAFLTFLNTHSVLLDVNANERSITHKLAEALQDSFPHMDVDCEYNRHGQWTKKIRTYCNETIRPDDLDAKTVYPDIVVHTRGTDENNVLVIEVKKKGNSRRDSDGDSEKLKAFTGEDLRYRIGLYIEIDCARASVSNVQCYKGGREVKSTIWDGLRTPTGGSH